MIETAIITVTDPERHYEKDLELPIQIPISKLRQLLIDFLWRMYQIRYDSPDTIQMKFQGKTIDAEQTLADAGVWEGSVIRIEEGTLIR